LNEKVFIELFSSDLDEKMTSAGYKRQSKDTYGQTRGLSNLEKKHVGELAVLVFFFNGVKTSRIHATQGSSYVTKNSVCLLVAYYRIGRVAKLQVNMVW